MGESRYEKVVAVIRLAQVLASNSEGLTLDEMIQSTGGERRTAERMRDAIERAFGQLERIEDGRKVRFRMPARGLGNFFNAPTSTELTELEHAANAHEAVRDADRAAILRSLQYKVRASLREAERRRLATDIEAQLHAEALACQVGPRPLSDARVMAALRQALLAGRMVKFRYGNQDDGTELRQRNVVPYGLLFAPRYYLVAATKNRSEPALYRLDRIHDIEVTDAPGAPPEGFNLKAYASRSFGVFQEEPEDIIVSFDASAAADARAYLFHPTQSMTDETDGSLTVRFRAAGLLQIAHHLMTWGSTVTILAPESLRNLIWEQIQALHAHHRPAKKEVPANGVLTS
jgi:predicted DNA-binding transcriptional regulator YafY